MSKTPTSIWTTFTNTKAMLANAGQKGEIYSNYTNFTTNKLRKHIGVYILHGLSPSPEIGMTFKGQDIYGINGNDFVAHCLGPSSTQRHEHLRMSFTVQDPLKISLF